MKKPLFQLDAIRPANTLFGRIVTAIHYKQEQSRLQHVRIFASSAFLSVAALVPVFINLIQAFKTSNFGVYFSLLFSDGGLFPAFWKELGIALVDSLPILAVAITLALIGILLWSLRGMVRFMNYQHLSTT